MLNEASLVWKGLKGPVGRGEIELPRQNRLVNPLKDLKRLLRVRLSNRGTVESVSEITNDEMPGLWRVGTTNQPKFPIISLRGPLIDVAKEEVKSVQVSVKKLKNELLAERLQELIHERSWKAEDDKGWSSINGSLERAEEILTASHNVGSLSHVHDLVERFRIAASSPKNFIIHIVEMCFLLFSKNSISDLSTANAIVTGAGGKASFALDTDEVDSRQRVYSLQTYQLMVDKLPTDFKDRESLQVSDRCAFNDEDSVLLAEPFPAVTFPELGSKPLLSMGNIGEKNDDCCKRYGVSKYAVCPVGSKHVRTLQSTLSWLVHGDNEGNTWLRIPSGQYEIRNQKKTEKRDLLISFLEAEPIEKTSLARIIGRSPKEITANSYKADASAVCEALHGVAREHPKSRLNLFILTKANDGAAKVVASESPTVQQVLDAVGWWTDASENAPAVALWLPPNDDKPAVWAKPLSPSPTTIVRLLSQTWMSSRKKFQEVNGPSVADVLDVYLWRNDKWEVRNRWEPAARKLLSLAIERTGPLLIELFAAVRTSYSPDERSDPSTDMRNANAYSRWLRQSALSAISLIGIILHAFGHRKERYMSDPVFIVGQMLALADTLHKDYCIIERDGSLPPSLIGSSLMPRALDSPVSALASLADRMSLYLRWASALAAPPSVSDSSPEEEQGSQQKKRGPYFQAFKTLKRYQVLADKVHKLQIPNECTDLDKAQLLFGFLASPPKTPKNNSEGENDGSAI